MDDALTKELDEVRITTGENISMARGTKLGGGSFASYIHHDSKLGVLLQFEGELPEDVATGICQHIAANVPTPMAVDESGLPGDLVALKAGEAKAEAENSGKPPEIAAKIAEGKMRKFFEEVTLLGQKYVRDDSKQISSLLPDGTTLKEFRSPPSRRRVILDRRRRNRQAEPSSQGPRLARVGAFLIPPRNDQEPEGSGTSPRIGSGDFDPSESSRHHALKDGAAPDASTSISNSLRPAGKTIDPDSISRPVSIPEYFVRISPVLLRISSPSRTNRTRQSRKSAPRLANVTSGRSMAT